MKKALSLMLVLVLVLGMSTVAFAADTKINKNDANRDQVFITNKAGERSQELDVLVQDGIKLDLDVINFEPVIPFRDWGTTANAKYAAASNPRTASAATLTEDGIKYNKVTLKTVITKGAKAIDEVKFEYSAVAAGGTPVRVKNSKADAFVQVVFNDEFTNNVPDGVEYEIKIYLVVDGRQWADSGFTLSGDYYNDSDTYYESSDGSVYMGDGTIIMADGYMKSVEMDLGEGVLAYGKMFKDRNYYGKADIDVYDIDEEFMDKYEIDAVYHVNEAGLKAVVEYVNLDSEDSSSFVYTIGANGKLAYVGKGDDDLPLLGTYYLSTKELTDLDEEIEPDEGEEIPSDEIEKPVDGGGDDFYPENANDNPGTGC